MDLSAHIMAIAPKVGFSEVMNCAVPPQQCITSAKSGTP